MTKYFPQPSADEVANEAKRSKTLADFFPDSQPLSLNAFLEVSSGHGVVMLLSPSWTPPFTFPRPLSA